jgi:hypothetical protein
MLNGKKVTITMIQDITKLSAFPVRTNKESIVFALDRSTVVANFNDYCAMKIFRLSLTRFRHPTSGVRLSLFGLEPNRLESQPRPENHQYTVTYQTNKIGY